MQDRKWTPAEIKAMATDHIPDEYPLTLEEVKQLRDITELILTHEREVVRDFLKKQSDRV